jgi:hypothetical protein
MRPRRWATLLFSTALALAAPAVADAAPAGAHPGDAEVLVSGLQGAFGSTVGPDGGLYVTEGVAGRITRVDLRTGATSTVADCLPRRIFGAGGAVDVAFLGRTAYALVTLVDRSVPNAGGTSVSGIYRIDGPHTCTVVADIGAFAIANPPQGFPFVVPSGVQYAFEPHGHGFVVTDGHHNRLYEVSLGGRVSQLLQLPNVVPTGLSVVGRTLYLAEAGPVPHLPPDGRVVAFPLRAPRAPGSVVASGAPLLVDVERGYGNRLFALAQGHFTPGRPAGSPADPGTGLLLRVDRHGGFDVVAAHLDRPTSLEIVRNTAYVVTLAGQVVRIHGLSAATSTPAG